MAVFKVVITAGGTSSRFGKTNKLFAELNGKPVICYSADLFTEMGFDIVIPCNETAISDMKNLFRNYKNIKIITGGNTRQESVFKGLSALGKCDYVIIHDGARPLIKRETVEKGIREVQEKKAVITAVKTTDTIKIVDENKKIINTPDRNNLINVQTPQIFGFELIYNAHLENQNKNFTDDACLIEAVNQEVFYIDGEYSNIKITNQIDIDYAEILLKRG